MQNRTVLPFLLVSASVVLVLGMRQNTPPSPQDASVNAAVVRAVLRDLAIPERSKISVRPGAPIYVINESLQMCPPPPEAVRGCVAPELLAFARREGAKGLWSFELADELAAQAKKSVTNIDLDVSGLTDVVVGPGARTTPGSVGLQTSRAAVRGRDALVIVQFAQTYVWLVLLNDKGAGWTVTTKVAWSAS